MKKQLLTLLVLVLFGSAKAQTVTKQEAQQVASTFLKANGQNPSAIETKCVLKEQNNAPLYWLVQYSSGWAMVSASNVNAPILAYNTKGQFSDSIPAVANLTRHIVPQEKKQTAAQWQTLRTGTFSAKRGVVLPLLETAWQQLAPFNNLCPADQEASNGRVPTGCGALSMVQIMNYHQWPTQGVGSAQYESSYGPLSANFATATYTYPLSDADKALLSYHAGVSVSMQYAAPVSLSHVVDIARVMKENFKYSASLNYQRRTLCSETKWKQMIVDELDASRPIMYSSFDSKEKFGHIFIIDGYDGMGLVHCNWGWGGLSDGFYDLNSLNPSGINFDSEDEMLIGIAPNRNTITYLPDLMFSRTKTTADSLLINNTLRPDLPATELYTTDPICYHFAVVNRGNAAAVSDEMVAVYLDNKLVDSLFSDGQVVEWPFWSMSAIYVYLSAGTHTIKLVIDPHNKIAELNEQNNTISRTFVVTAKAPQPNLVLETASNNLTGIRLTNVVNGTVGSVFKANDSIFAKCYLYNYGSNTKAAFDVALQLDGTTIETKTIASAPNMEEIQLTFALKAPAEGQHTFTLLLDNNNSIAETRETDNTYTQAFTVEPAILQNLEFYKPSKWDNAVVVSDIATSTSNKSVIASNKDVFVSFAFLNNGNADITQEWLYSVSVDGVEIHRLVVNNTPQNSVTAFKAIKLGVLSTGNHIVSIRLDANNLINETNETDNTKSVSMYVGPYPDLLLAHPTQTDTNIVLVSKQRKLLQMQNTFTETDSLFVHTGVTNLGTDQYSGLFQVKLLVDGVAKDSIRYNYLEEGQVEIASNLKAGKLNEGNHTIKIKIENLELVAENTLNNTDSLQIYVWPTSPILDLTFYDNKLDSMIVANKREANTSNSTFTNKDSVFVNILPANVGKLKFQTPFLVQIYANNQQLFNHQYNNLAAGAFFYARNTNIGRLKAGYYTIKSIIDPYNQFAETNENNNIVERRIVVYDTAVNLAARKIKIYNEQDTSLNKSSFSTNDDLFIKLAWSSTRFAPINGSINIIIKLDDVELKTLTYTSSSLQYDTAAFNISLGKLPYGSHKISFVVDNLNAIAESNEEDNTLETNINISLPKIPGKPSGSSIVCAETKGEPYTIASVSDATAYQWVLSPSNAGIITGNSNNITIDWGNSFADTAYLKVTAQTANGNRGYSDSLTIIVVKNPEKPIITLLLDQSICGDGPSGLKVETKYNKTVSYLWSNGKTESSITTKGGSFWVKVTNAAGCVAMSDLQLVPDAPQPEHPAVTYKNQSLFAEPGGRSYVWYDENNKEVSQSQIFETPTQGKYYYIMKKMNGCSVTSQTYTYGNTATTQEMASDIEFNYNAANRTAQISSPALPIQSVSVFALSGQLLLTDQPCTMQYLLTLPITEGLLVQVKTANGETVYKIK